jgi:lysophospholipase L1-like esterase
MISNYTYDGVHLNLKGYQLIEPMVEEAIQNVLE